jgi:hypothetical protein
MSKASPLLQHVLNNRDSIKYAALLMARSSEAAMKTSSHANLFYHYAFNLFPGNSTN